jgi:glycerophosphoryl diester phosphodiesterase
MVFMTLNFSGAPSSYGCFIAHRGNTAGPHNTGQENTISALNKVADSGCQLMEIDVRQTSDGVVICWHDHDILINGSRMPVMDLSWAAIQKQHTNVCTLEEMLQSASEKNVRLVIEMKTGMAGVRAFLESTLYSINSINKSFWNEQERNLGQSVGNVVKNHLEQAHPPLAPYIITSYQKESLMAARQSLEGVAAQNKILFTRMYFDVPQNWQNKWAINQDGRLNHYDGIHLHLSEGLKRNSFEELLRIRETIGSNHLLIVFTVDCLETINTLLDLPEQYRPDHIITNCYLQAAQERIRGPQLSSSYSR